MAPTLWHAIAASVSIACLIWISRDLRRQPLPKVLVFVVYALFFRFLLSAFSAYTFPALVGPFSINALYSLLVIGLGLLIINQRLLLLRFLIPIHAIIVLIIVSALYNGTFAQSIQSLVKWLFFIVIAVAVYESLLRAERTLVIEKLIKSFAIPVILQLVSVAVGHAKLTENDGSISYLGGYNHESVFSVMLVTALILAALRQLLQPPAGPLWRFLPLLFAAGIVLANYRTNILAMLLPLAGFMWFRFLHSGQGLSRVFAFLLMITSLGLLTLMDFSAIIERFSEIGTVLDESAALFKSPQYYTDWEQKYFSARVYIWSQYIDGYLRGDLAQHLIGMGADTWDTQFRKYAHNTFVGSLYELGLAGTCVLGYFFLANMFRALTGPLTSYSTVLFLGLLGFLIMNLGTMPLWQIEGMVLFAVLNALVWERSLVLRSDIQATETLVRRQEDPHTKLHGPRAPAPFQM